MSENTLIARALTAMVAVVALGVVGALVGVRNDRADAQVVDRAGNYIAVTGTVAGRNEQVLYLINTRDNLMIVYKYDGTERILYRLAETNVDGDFQLAKQQLDATGVGAVQDRYSVERRQQRR